MSSAEFYTQPVLGWRTWAISNDPMKLTGVVYTSYAWEPRKETKAVCARMRGKVAWITTTLAKSAHDKFGDPCERAPTLECNDGFHGFYDPEPMFKSGLPFSHSTKSVRGSFQAWGKIILHKEGFRAEYVQPIAFIQETFDSLSRWMPMAFKQDDATAQESFKIRSEKVRILAEKYDVPVLPYKDIVKYSQKYGSLPSLT